MTRLTRRSSSPARAKTFIEQLQEDPKTANEFAAARLTSRVQQTLRRAFNASPLNQKELADLLGVGESRVSQILNGDGNIRITALARYLRALGYEAEITANPVGADRPAIAIRPRHRDRPNVENDVYIDLLQDDSGNEKFTRLVIQEAKFSHTDHRVVASKKLGTIRDATALESSILKPANMSWPKASSYVHLAK